MFLYKHGAWNVIKPVDAKDITASTEDTPDLTLHGNNVSIDAYHTRDDSILAEKYEYFIVHLVGNVTYEILIEDYQSFLMLISELKPLIQASQESKMYEDYLDNRQESVNKNRS